DLVHPSAHLRQMLADLDASDIRGNRIELAAHLRRRVRLEIDHVLRGGAAEQIKEDDALSPPWTPVPPCFLRLQKLRQPEAAEQSERASLQSFAPGQSITRTPRRAEHRQHGGILT